MRFECACSYCVLLGYAFAALLKKSVMMDEIVMPVKTGIQ
jgi:hypothetical protein